MVQGGYIRIQNKSSFDVKVGVKNKHNIDGKGIGEIKGSIAPGGQLPESKNGETKFGGNRFYQYIEGDKRFRVQKDGSMEIVVNVEGSSPSSLKLKVNTSDWWAEDKSPDKESKVKAVADVDEVDDTFKIEIRIYDNYRGNSWMAEMAKHIENTPLCNVGLPGTHDSGTYQFDKDMGASPDSDLTKSIQDKLDKGGLLSKLTDTILSNVFERLCQCQDASIKNQLEAGIRYLDLRVAFHKDTGKYYTCHGVFCADMADIMKDINAFLEKNPKEIVILDFNHLYEMDGHHKEFVDDIVLATLGDKAASNLTLQPDTVVGEYWKEGMQAVVIYCDKTVVKDHQQDGKLWPQQLISSPWPNVIDATALHDKLKGKLEKRNKNKFFVLQGILTPDGELIKSEVMTSGGMSMKSMAKRVGVKVIDWVDEDWKEHSHNIVIVDFFQDCSIVPATINFNRK